MNIYGYADAEQLSFFEFKIASENLVVYESIEQFNEKEAGVTTREPEEKLFGTHIKELKETLKGLIL